MIDTFQIGGGAQTQLAGLSAMLKSRNNEVIALSYYKVPEEQSFEPYLREHGIQYICLDNVKSMVEKIYGTKKIISQYNPDTVVAYIDGPTTICCILKAMGVKFHLIVSERNVTQKLNIKERIKFNLYRFSDVIVPNSYTQANFIKRHYPFLIKKVHTISNFVDTDIFYPQNFIYDGHNCLNILVVARIDPQKNVFRFLDAMSLLKNRHFDFHVDWFGKPTSGYFQDCIDKVHSLNLDSYISFHEAIKNVNYLYTDSKYDVYCLPSLFEGCPNTIGEAMACGLPVLCSDVCDNSIYVKNGENGLLFNPTSVSNIAETIISFSRLSEETKISMRYNNRLIAMKKLSKMAFITEYIKIIE